MTRRTTSRSACERRAPPITRRVKMSRPVSCGRMVLAAISSFPSGSACPSHDVLAAKVETVPPKLPAPAVRPPGRKRKSSAPARRWPRAHDGNTKGKVRAHGPTTHSCHREQDLRAVRPQDRRQPPAREAARPRAPREGKAGGKTLSCQRHHRSGPIFTAASQRPSLPATE
jgi:hypothetical protein